MTDHLTEMQCRLLTNLATYRYLTADQMVRLGVPFGTAKTRMYGNLRSLAEGKKPLIAAYKPHPLPNEGRLPFLHYLTKHGAERAADMLEMPVSAVKFPHHTPMFRNHYRHVTHSIDDEISVRQWADGNGHAVDWFHSYLDTTGANRGGSGEKRRNVTKIEMEGGEYCIPDAVCKLTDEYGTDRLFVFEVHNQMRTKRIEERLLFMRHALSQQVIERQFAYDGSPRICVVFETETALSAAAKRMAGSGKFRGFEPFFYFTTHEVMARDFRHGWRRIDDTRGAALF